MSFHPGKLDLRGEFLGHLWIKLELGQGTLNWVRRMAGFQAAGVHLMGWQALGWVS